MESKEILLSRARELKERAADNSMITCTNFLSVDERNALNVIERENNKYIDTFYYGGFDEAERTVAVFVPNFLAMDDIVAYMKENDDENPLALIKVTKDKFTAMSHRDYLGSLMALGIKREMLGDILVSDNGCHFFCVKSIANYITENLTRTGRGSVKCEIAPINALQSGSDNGKMIFCSVASLRLDAVVASAFSLSRSNAFEYINKGTVYVNSVQCFKGDFTLNVGDKIVLRGKGKAVIDKLSGTSKKGRLHIEIKRYF